MPDLEDPISQAPRREPWNKGNFALTYDLGFSIPMLIGCLIGGGSWCLALYLGPETKGKDMVPDLVLA